MANNLSNKEPVKRQNEHHQFPSKSRPNIPKNQYKNAYDTSNIVASSGVIMSTLRKHLCRRNQRSKNKNLMMRYNIIDMYLTFQRGNRYN